MNRFIPRLPPEFEPRAPTGCSATLYAEQPVDSTLPFREFLARVFDDLAREDHQAKLDLPPYLKNDDCVYGSMHWRGEDFMIYFEHSLGYLEFQGSSRQALETLVNIAVKLA